MPECQNCGSHVTQQYARVFSPNGVENPRVCPHCEDKIRDRHGIREARSPRRHSNRTTSTKKNSETDE